MSSFDWQSVVDIVVSEFPTYIPVPSRDVEDYRIFNFMRLAEEGNPSGYPKFHFYGNEGDISFSSSSEPNPIPEVTSMKLWACNERAFGYSRGMTFSLGTISEHKVSYGRLDSWLRKLKGLRSESVNLCKENELFIIHSAITAEMLIIKDGNEERKAVLNRPKEFGGFPIGFRVGTVRYSYSTLSLEDLKYFNMPYKEWFAKHETSKSAK